MGGNALIERFEADPAVAFRAYGLAWGTSTCLNCGPMPALPIASVFAALFPPSRAWWSMCVPPLVEGERNFSADWFGEDLQPIRGAGGFVTGFRIARPAWRDLLRARTPCRGTGMELRVSMAVL